MDDDYSSLLLSYMHICCGNQGDLSSEAKLRFFTSILDLRNKHPKAVVDLARQVLESGAKDPATKKRPVVDS